MVAIPYADVDRSVPVRTEAGSDDERLVVRLRNGDEGAFCELVERHHAAMVNLATIYVRSRAVAEEVVQDTWVAVLNGIDRFEGRSSLKTWLYRILVNRAMTRGKRESRCLTFSHLCENELYAEEAAVDPSRFINATGASSGAWAGPPTPWEDHPEERLLSGEVRERLRQAIAQLTPTQRTVITLRDVEGWSSQEVCNALGISETNQRVLLHRARAKVRGSLEQYLEQS